MISIPDFLNAYSLIACVVVLLWYHSTSTFNYWKKLNVKFKTPIPFFGNFTKVLTMQQAMFENLDEIYVHFKNEPFVGYYMMREPTLLVKDPEFVTRVLITDFKFFVDRGFDTSLYMDKEFNPLTNNLFFINGDRWRKLRQRLSPVFTSGKLKLMYEQIRDCVSLMNELISNRMADDGADVNVRELFQGLTIDVIGSCAFGLECNSLKTNNEFRQRGVEAFEPRRSNFIKMLVTTTCGYKPLKMLRLRDVKKKVSDFFLNVALDTLVYRKENGVSRDDFLQMLMELQNTSRDSKYSFHNVRNKVLVDEEFDEIDIAANAFLFFTAGFETTASTLSYCLYELALNTQVQDKLRSEVQQVFAENQTVNPEIRLKKMTYMDAVISETLRKYPIATQLNRKCTKDYQIPNTNVKLASGTNITIPVWSIQHDCRYYPNPEVFDPERFTVDNKNGIVNGTYMPFGDGPRICLGKRFAEMEMKGTLADMILKYEFAKCKKTQIPLVFKPGSLILSPKSGIWINISKRKF